MRWTSGRRSTNVEDRRGMRVGRPMAIGGGGTILLVILFTLICGGDPTQLLRILEGVGGGTAVQVDQGPVPTGPPQDELGGFVSVVLGDTEDTWGRIFASSGQTYPPPTLVLFTDLVESACGLGQAAMGPFYCPPDRRVYIDLGFYRELRDRFGADGDFAQAYVIAHEVGHHVQNVLGISDDVRGLQERDPAGTNALSVNLELQADCLAGVWAHHAARRDLLEPGDVEEALTAASAIGDDRIQEMSGRGVNPESWTHGSAEQRVSWLRRGMESGQIEVCDTFR